jgi:hypothetical protein
MSLIQGQLVRLISEFLSSAILASPQTYVNQSVRLTGEYRGWEGGHGWPPVTKSDWVLTDPTGAIYVTGDSLGMVYPIDLGKTVTVQGIVRINDGQTYIEIPRSPIRR